jgi:uncharacterized protein (DUF1697 family)
MTARIAMWSGPRNISTAMMRAWGNRADTGVTDEPLYGFYLKETGVDHPGREEVIESMECDWRKVAPNLTGPAPGGRPIWYQKHMAHHLLPQVERGWIGQLTNCFLIRDPARVLVSLAKVTPNPGLRDLGLAQQVELFRAERLRIGHVPPVLDAADVLRDPKHALAELCAAVGVPFDIAMLFWPPGRRATDGVWAKWWYQQVEKSTGFEPDLQSMGAIELPARLRGLYEECLPCTVSCGRPGSDETRRAAPRDQRRREKPRAHGPARGAVRAAGCDEVRTYIQSGNVVYCAGSPDKVCSAITRALAKKLKIDVPVVTRTAAELQRVVNANPFTSAAEGTVHVAFLADKPSSTQIAGLDPQRSPGDSFVVRGREVYLHLPNGVGRTRLTNACLTRSWAP